MNQSKISPLIITGMHRSGTSLTADLLRRVGVNLGDRLLPGSRGNIRGHFEDIEILEFHRDILRSQGFHPDGWVRQSEIPVPETFIEPAREIIGKKSQPSLWGWKEPRTSLFLDFWRELLPEAGFIFIYRSPWEVADSLYRRGTDRALIENPELAILSWIHYNTNILKFCDRHPEKCAIVHLHKVAHSPAALISAINEKFNLQLPSPEENPFEAELLKTEISETFRPGIIKRFYPEAVDLYLALDARATPLNGEPALSWASPPASLSPQDWAISDWLEIRQRENQNRRLETELERTHTRLHDAQIDLERYRAQAKIWESRQGKIDRKSALPFLPPHTPPRLTPYEAWLRVNQWNGKAKRDLEERLETVADRLPKISIIMPVYNPPPAFLQRAIASVTGQVYKNWELCIADDRSTEPEIHSLLETIAEDNPKVKVIFRDENGNISQATNTAIRIAEGEFLLFLDHDDELTPDALGEVGFYLAEHPDTDILYSDDDKIDTDGRRFSPQFKPDYSPELLLSYMYFGHLLTVRKTLCDRLGGMRPRFDGAQDYDFVLRASELTRNIAHLPLILYHWRVLPGSTAASGAAKPDSFSAAETALQETLERRGISGTVYQQNWAMRSHCGIFNIRFPDEGRSVSILIPTKNSLELLKPCLESLEKTSYKNYRIIIIDNESDDPQTLDYLRETPHRVIKLNNSGGGFNFASLMNRAAAMADGDYILFLNNDTATISPDWLSQMVGYLQIKDVGAVGAKLIFPNQTIQHGGVIFGLHHGLAGHAFKLVSRLSSGYLWGLNVAKNYSALSAACLLTPRELFLEMGGFDETEFAVAYNDVDYCDQLINAGFRCVYCPDAELIHREGASRGFADNPREVASFRAKYRGKVDPFYNPHLSLENEQFQIQPRRFIGNHDNRKIRVLMASNALDLTGAPLHQYELAIAFLKTDTVEPTAFCLGDGILREAYEENQIPVTVYGRHPLRNIYTLEGYETAISQLAAELMKHPVDVMYVNTLDNFFMVDCARKMGIPCIWNIHESEPQKFYAEWLDSYGPEIARRGLECFAIPYRVVFVSDASRDQYLALNGSHNFTVIHNGFNRETWEAAARRRTREAARRELGVSDSEIVILSLGTVCDRKGQRDLPPALRQLSPELQQQIRVFVVGDRPGPYSEKLHADVASLPESLRSRIEIVPETSDTIKYYRAADLFVFTSRVESFPRVILEAMASGLPIVATPVFGVKEQLQPGVNALFYQPGNIEELAIAITTLLNSQNLRDRFAANSPPVLASLTSFDEMLAGYRQLLREADFTIPDVSEVPQIKPKMNEPLVSVCIPLHNGETHLPATLKSLASQTYPNLEIIIADDCSEDRSLAIARQFASQSPENVSLFQHQQPFGLAQNCNFCLSQAKGKYVKFLFQDDILESDCIEKLVELAETDEKIGLVFSPRNLILSEGAEENQALMTVYNGCQNLHQSWTNLQPVQWGWELLSDPNILEIPLNKIGEPSVVLLRREVFQTVGGFDPELRQLVDLELWLRILTRYKVGFVNQPLSHFRLHLQQQTLKNAHSGVSDQVKFYQKLAFDSCFQTLPAELRYLAAATHFLLTERYQPADENTYPEILDNLRTVRNAIAQKWLNSPSAILEQQYVGLLGKAQKMLSNTSLKYHPPTPRETAFVETLKTQLELGFDNLNLIQSLLAFQLYGWGDEMPFFPEFSLFPNWLIKDSMEFMLKVPAYFREPGATSRYCSYLEEFVKFLHSRIFKYPKSKLWNAVAILFANLADFTILQYREDTETAYRMRSQILAFVMELQNQTLAWELPPQPPRKPVKLGILVPHLHPTPETLMTLPMYESLGDDFQVILYSLVATGNAIENYCRQKFRGFQKLPNSLEQQVDLIRQDELDILLISANLTTRTIAPVYLASHRLARVQICTPLSPVLTELNNVDYHIFSNLTRPDTANPQILPIAESGYCWATAQSPPRLDLDRLSLEISKKAVVFASGIDSLKITPELIESWGCILSEVPNSLLLIYPFWNQSDRAHLQKPWLQNCTGILEKYQIDPDRILLLNFDEPPSNSDLQSCLKLADIYLDSHPISDIISLFNAFNAGLPIVVKNGAKPHHSLGAALLREMGVSDLIAPDDRTYIQLAITLGNNPKFRQKQRRRMDEIIQNYYSEIKDNIKPSKNLAQILNEIATVAAENRTQ
ncbi:glycosyltransferase [Lyngbya sp. CCY1209]|uniref:glycosyltransferase n=1 Tax=Lyngbya sp. CCY1209 TaxID=2886103 RepID=UPI002D20B983|nr:glycosyltransferase [Lyngbya sp. CCY1209]MEB3886324.1 glycosyltransferase [Lyngbya sp. CCY1209]